MKKSIQLFFALFIVTAVFSSCASTESSVQSDKQEKEAYQENIQYSMTLPIELFEVADIEVTYAGNHDKLITEIVTLYQTVPIWDAGECAYYESEADYHKSDVVTKVVWVKSVMADSIPARVFISPRLLSKPCTEENMDKRYDLFAYMGYLYDTGVEVNEKSASYNDSIRPNVRMGKQECFLHCIDVSGSKIANFFDIANDNPVSLDFTIRRVEPGSPKLDDFENK